MEKLSRNCPANSESASFLPQCKMKMRAVRQILLPARSQ
jgi:hypothetical protein